MDLHILDRRLDAAPLQRGHIHGKLLVGLVRLGERLRVLLHDRQHLVDVVRRNVKADMEAVIEGHEQDLVDMDVVLRSEEHTSELQSLMSNSNAVFCLKKKNNPHKTH